MEGDDISGAIDAAFRFISSRRDEGGASGVLLGGPRRPGRRNGMTNVRFCVGASRGTAGESAG